MQPNDTPPSLTAVRRLPQGDEGRPSPAHRASRRHAPRWLVLFGGLAALAIGTPKPALALQGGEDPATLPVLIDKQAGLADKLQLSAFFSTTLATKFTESTGATLNVQYNFIDQFGLELVGGFYATSEAQIVEEVRAELADDPILSDLHQMQWVAALNAVWVPLYGKISFASEWNPSFDLYLLLGGGLVGTNRAREVGGVLTDESDTAPQFNFGGGLRIFIIPLVAVRLDIRNYFYADPDAGELTARGTEISGFTNALVGQVGVQLSFGGDQ